MKEKFLEKCGSCFFWSRVTAGPAALIGSVPRGDCYGSPPQVVPIINQGQLAGGMNIRAQTAQTDRACALYATESDLQMPANNDKH